MKPEVDRLKDIVYSIQGGGAIPIVAQYAGQKGYRNPLDLRRRMQLPESDAEPMILVLT